MTKTGILIETDNGSVKDTSLGVMAAAAGSEIYALVLGGDAPDLKDKLAEYGADFIVSLPSNILSNPDFTAQTIVDVAKEYSFDTLLGTASSIGKDLFARIAAIMDEPLVSDCVAVDINLKTVKKSHFSGKTFATLKLNNSFLLSTIRPNVIEPAPSPAAGEIIEFSPLSSDPGLMKIVEIKKDSDTKLDLTEASIIITGGRAINSEENFSMLDTCAEKLGAAVGASRAAVDAGYAPHSLQVGQTGKTVSPKLYIACGVSGAVQHFAGMKTSKVIVAINEDKDAPIFAKCDYGIVGDIFEVVPALTNRI